MIGFALEWAREEACLKVEKHWAWWPLARMKGCGNSTDEHGRFNLNALHRASGTGDHKRPSKWLNNKQAQEVIQELVHELGSGGRNSGLATKSMNCHPI